MKRSGWYGQSWRHSLAARGVKTQRYFQRKKAKTIRAEELTSQFQRVEDTAIDQPRLQESVITRGQRIGTGRDLIKERRKAIEETAKELRRSNQILRDVENNRFDEAVLALNDPSRLQEADPVERKRAVSAIRTALNAKAIQLANAGIPPPDPIMDNIDASVAVRVDQVLRARQDTDAQDTESALNTFAREVAPGALVESLIETPATGVRFLGSGQGEDLNQALISNIDNEVPRAPGQIDTDLKDNPFVDTNAFIGNEEQSTAALKPLPDGVPRLQDNFDFVQGGPGSNPALASPGAQKRTAADVVDNRVDELYSARNNLANVDLSAFDKGTKAFQTGDREELIKQITILQREEQTLKDRFALVNSTGADVVSQQNRTAAFSKKSGNFIMDLAGNGGDRIAEQTKKINAVREKILQANNKVYARRRQLESRLQRLDATVPPETDVPQQVKRFNNNNGGGSFGIGDVPNVTLGALRGQQ